MNARRAGILTLLAVGASSIAATPAGAATAPITAGGSFAKTIPFIDGQLYVYECHAAAPGAVSTSITSCDFAGSPAPPVTSQGPAAVTEGGLSQDATPSQLCWTASAVYSGGSTQSTSGCSTISDTAGAGVSVS